MDGKKFIVGIAVVTLLFFGGYYVVDILEDKIVVSLPSDVCDSATLRVTKDDFTFKCGNRIAFQADTLTHYYKTYGLDEWVRNNRFVGRNKKDIALELVDFGDYFEIIRTTRYRKGRQSVADGVLSEMYTFTKDKIKVSYNYEVNNKALHRVSMRIKKQYRSFLDGSDPGGMEGILINNILSYEGYGDLLIDPTVTLNSPATANTTVFEGDSIVMNCSAQGDGNYSAPTNGTQTHNITNITLIWSANGSDISNGTTSFSALPFNVSVYITRVVPHQLSSDTSTTNFTWTCYACAINGSSDANCTRGANNSIFPYYRPHPINITSPKNDVPRNVSDLNILNGTDWRINDTYPLFVNETNSGEIIINWSYPSTRISPDGRNVTYNLSYFGTTNPTRMYSNFVFNASNATTFALWNVSNLPPDDYYVTVVACGAINTTNGTLCVNDTTTIPVEVFDYTYNFSSSSVNGIRFSPQPSLINGAALGQSDTEGLIAITFLGYSYPDGVVNVTLNYTNYETSCLDITANVVNDVSTGYSLINSSKVTILNVTDAATKYIWLWGTKDTCGTTTTNFLLSAEVLD